MALSIGALPGSAVTNETTNLEEEDMSNIRRQWLVMAFLLVVLSPWFQATAAAPTEENLIKDLESPKASVVTKALQNLERNYPTSTKAVPAIRKLLADSRLEVKRKAARVLGILHGEVDQNDIKNICGLLKENNPASVIDGLKSLRGLNAPSAVPEILPLLKHAHPNVIRDACRTLAVLGNKDIIPQLEPLLAHADSGVKKDAQDAIFKLKEKS